MSYGIVNITVSNGMVTNITVSYSSCKGTKVLETDRNYTTPYTPQYDGSPATKKYVDDAIAALKAELAESITTEAIIMENTPQLYTDAYKANNPDKFTN